MSEQPRELVLLSRAEQVLAEASTIDEVKDLRDKAQAARVYATKAGLSKTIIVHASTIKVQAERRLGEMLRVLPLANGAPGNQYTGKVVRSQKEPATAQEPTMMPRAVCGTTPGNNHQLATRPF